MKLKEFQEYKNKSVAELQKDLNLYRSRLANLKFDLAAGKVKNIQEIRAVKKTIAQLLSLINSKT